MGKVGKIKKLVRKNPENWIYQEYNCVHAKGVQVSTLGYIPSKFSRSYINLVRKTLRNMVE